MSTTRGCRFKIIRSRTGAMRRRPFTNMKWPVTLILLVGLDILSQQKVSTCVVDQMTDTTFCRGSLQVSYTTIGMVNCVIIPKCFRTLLSTMLGQPSVLFPTADEIQLRSSGDGVNIRGSLDWWRMKESWQLRKESTHMEETLVMVANQLDVERVEAFPVDRSHWLVAGCLDGKIDKIDDALHLGESNDGLRIGSRKENRE
ncbi:uncharacterized protein [Heterodontus francisci]|uniref:uncharacterized protein isoform X2 n=1 Tax=Heterodontus francisci TaxID=7792 RepID=UPI00355B8A88